MNIFEQFANMKSDDSVAVTKTTDEVKDDTIDLVDDGEGNLMMHIPGDPTEIVEKNKAKEELEKQKEEVKEKKKSKKKSGGIEVKSLKEEVPVKTANELVEEKLVEYPKIIVKVFGEKLYEFDNADEIKMLKVEDITNRLIVEHDYEEFANGVNWTVAPNADKTVGYLIPTYKFHPKG